MIVPTRMQQALQYAAAVHNGQLRKGTNVPYLTHVLAVAAIVGEAGGDETEIIAALLHDAAEDHGGRSRLDEIRGRFGDAVADLVSALSDTLEQPKPPWRQRKEQYLQRLAHEPAPVRRIAAADKLHNARSILADLRAVGLSVFDRFRGGREGTLWYYDAAVRALSEAGSSPLVEQLSEAVSQLLKSVDEAMGVAPLTWSVKIEPTFSCARFTIPDASVRPLRPGDLPGIALPAELLAKRHQGIVLSGAGPVWLYAHLTHLAHAFAWVAIFVPQLDRAVVVMRHADCGGPPVGGLVECPATCSFDLKP